MASANPSTTTVSRRSRPKTRTGCLTCKRVKCDERKPSCLRCLSTKRICEGYPILDRPTIAITNQLTDEERRAFSYFRSRTAHRIFGEQDANEWVPVILQIAHVEPAIRHGITALASLHESLEPVNELTWLRQSPRDRSLSAQMLALRHYNHAIQSLRSESIDMSSRPDITMVLCILFLCFEQFRSGDAACLVHLTAGLKLIDWWRSRTDNYTKLKDYPRPTLEFMNEKITPIMQRLRVQFSLCMDSRHSWRGYGVTYGLPPPAIPLSYSSFDAARRDFDRAMNYMFSILENNQVACHREPARDPSSVLHQWKDSLDSSGLSSHATHLQTCSRRLLELYYHVSILIMGTYYTEVETTFDAYMEQFETIVELAEQIAIDWQHATKDYSLLFSFDLGLTPPMFLVASRCRHPDIRRRAVRLMLESPFYHGVWPDRYTGLCAQRIVEIEEAGMESHFDGSRYVPEPSRIRKVSADLRDTKEHIAMRFVRSPFVENARVYTTMVPLTS